MTLLDDAHQAFQAEKDMSELDFNTMMDGSMDGYTDAEREYGLALSEKTPVADTVPRDAEYYDTMCRNGSVAVDFYERYQPHEFED